MLRVNCASLDDTWLLLSLKNYGPLTLRLIPLGFFDCSAGPDVQLEKLCVRLEELSKLILGGEDFTKLAMQDKTFTGVYYETVDIFSDTYLANVQES